MSSNDSAVMENALVGDPDPEIVAREAALRLAQLSADAKALDRLISDDLLFTGPNGELVTKAEDLESHASGAVRFLEHVPDELRTRRIGSNVAVSALRARLVVEVGGNVVSGVFRYTRVWSRENGHWQVVGGHVSEVHSPASS